MNIKLIKTIISSLVLTVNFINVPWVKSQGILEKIEQTGLLKVAITANAIPFGYRDGNQELRGICFDLIRLIKKELKTQLNRDIITTHLFISDLANRYQIVQNNIVYLECGANSIREVEDYNITFSQPFFVTGTQFLVSRDKVPELTQNVAVEDLRIGVLRYTTTEEYIKNRFPQAQISLFQGTSGSSLGVQAVQNERLDAFADDGILLVGAATSLGMSLTRDYVLLPETPITCERYGLILPEDDPSWSDFINFVIDSNEEKAIIGDWFSVTQKLIKNTPDCTLEEAL